MKIIHLVPAFSILSETFIYDHICEMQRQGIENHVVTFSRQQAKARPFKNITVIPASIPQRIGQIIDRIVHQKSPLENDFQPYQSGLQKAIAKISPDAIHAHFGPAGVVVAPIAKSLQIPLAVTFYGYDISLLLRFPIWRECYRSLFQTAAHFFAVSQYFYNKMLEIGAPASRMSILHTGNDLKKFQLSNPLERFDGQNIRFIFNGRLIEKKDPFSLIQAFRLCQKKLSGDKKIQLSLIGSGPLYSKLKALIRQLELTNSVHLLGAINHSEIPAKLQTAHIYVQHCVTPPNGDQEGIPISIREAMATGLPIVSTRHSGIPEVVIDGVSGYLVDEGDVIGMAEKMHYLCTHPNLWPEFGKAGRTLIEKEFSLKNQTLKAILVFQNLLRQT